MLALETIVGIGLCIVLAALLAPVLRVPAPIVQVATGVLLGFVPVFRDVQLPSEAVLLLFLPAILFWESLNTSRREMRRYLRVIVLNGTLLVVVTAFTTAWAATAFGITWAAAFVLGAALAPTDATAVGSLAKALPRRQRTVIQAESLINDGTALVIYSLAVAVAAGTEQVTPLSITWTLVVSFVGGILIGGVIGLIGIQARRIPHVLASNVGAVLTPFAAFLAAELVHASGVLAVVVAGLVVSQLGPRAAAPAAREQVMSFWGLTSYILNGALFVLIGLELQVVIRALPGDQLGLGLLLGVVIWLVILLTRLAFNVTATAIIRAVDRRPYQRTLRSPWRVRMVGVLAGFRGAVSLAAALAIPLSTASGDDFPFRDLLIFATAVVIVLTLVVQGPLLAPIIRWARIAPDESEAQERRTAEIAASRAAIEALPDLAEQLGVGDEVRDKALHEAQRHLRALEARDGGSEGDDTTRRGEEYTKLTLAALAVKRDTVLRLRDEREIDDIVMRRVQSQLDLEELRLQGRADAD